MRIRVNKAIYLWTLSSILAAFMAVHGEIAAQDNAGSHLDRNDANIQSVLTVSPREIDLGTLGPGEERKGVFYLRNIGPAGIAWSTEGPEGWSAPEYRDLSGAIAETPQPVTVRLLFVNDNLPGKILTCSLLLRIEWGDQYALFSKEAPVGVLRESIRFNFAAGSRTVFFNARLTELAAESLLDVEPMRMDLGMVGVGEQISRRVHVKNRGREPLIWKAGLAGTKGIPKTALNPQGKYVSFLNESVAGTGSYLVGRQAREGLEISGQWSEEKGYPATEGEQCVLRYRFTGTGLSLLIRKTPEGGTLSVFLDERFLTFIDSFGQRREQIDAIVAEDQPEIPHLLTIVSDGGKAIIEGVRIFGKPAMKGPRGWISVSPDSGVTNREIDYVNITLNTRQLVPGIYSEYIHFTSNGGDASVEVFLEVATDVQARLLDCYRYLAGSDYLYTTNPQGETSRLLSKGYRNLGIAFRLFSSATPGTTDFFRWFNPTKGDHFYSSDASGGGKSLQGYLFEGSIGNIATSRLTRTRELYRWYNPKTGRHFFTTNQGGEGLGKKGYRFDGIAGFVR